MEPLNVLSLFDGIGCARLALARAEIPVARYFRSEIDPHANQVVDRQWGDTVVNLGDVQNIDSKTLPKIDLLIGGSPCQGLSLATIDRLNLDDPRSKLFFEFVRLKEELNPKYFLLENVRMNRTSRDTISRLLRVDCVELNSSLVSAQYRNRLYWTNVPFSMPHDKGIKLKDILENGTASEQMTTQNGKAHCHTATYQRVDKPVSRNGLHQIGIANINGHDNLKRVYGGDGLSPTLNACTGGNREPKTADGSQYWRRLTPTECESLQTVPKNYTASVPKTARYKLLGNAMTVDIISHIFKSLSGERKRPTLRK